MKNLILVITTLFLGMSFLANAQTKEEVRDVFTIQVDGLGCPFCAYGLEKKFKELKGIEDIKIEMETGVFTFTYPDTKMLSIEQVENQVDAAGYTAVSTKIERSTGEVEMSEMTGIELPEEGEIQEKSFYVFGNCGMCQERIEKAVKGIEGVTTANWDKESKMLTVNFDATQTAQEEIEKVVVASGHDTKMEKTAKKVYKKLPACCQYEREQ